MLTPIYKTVGCAVRTWKMLVRAAHLRGLPVSGRAGIPLPDVRARGLGNAEWQRLRQSVGEMPMLSGPRYLRPDRPYELRSRATRLVSRRPSPARFTAIANARS